MSNELKIYATKHIEIFLATVNNKKKQTSRERKTD